MASILWLQKRECEHSITWYQNHDLQLFQKKICDLQFISLIIYFVGLVDWVIHSLKPKGQNLIGRHLSSTGSFLQVSMDWVNNDVSPAKLFNSPDCKDAFPFCSGQQQDYTSKNKNRQHWCQSETMLVSVEIRFTSSATSLGQTSQFCWSNLSSSLQLLILTLAKFFSIHLAISTFVWQHFSCSIDFTRSQIISPIQFHLN